MATQKEGEGNVEGRELYSTVKVHTTDSEEGRMFTSEITFDFVVPLLYELVVD